MTENKSAEKRSNVARKERTAKLKRIAPYVGLAALMIIAPVVGLYFAKREDRRPPPAKALAVSPPSDAGSRAPDAIPPEDFVAVLLPPQMADLMQRAQGRVTRVHVKVGQRVSKGDLLVELDQRDRQQDLRLAQAALKAAKAQAGAAGAAARGAAQLAKRQGGTVTVGGKQIDIVAAADIEQAKAQAGVAGGHAAAAAADVGVMQERVNQAQLALEETRVSAPFDGIVTQILFESGTMVNPGDVVARVIDSGPGWRTRIAVPEEFGAMVRGAKRAQIKFDNRMAFADIAQRSVEVDPASRTFMLEGTIVNAAEACGGDCTFLAGREVRAVLVDP
jgi:RND family efflux transporter MFP subunit